MNVWRHATLGAVLVALIGTGCRDASEGSAGGTWPPDPAAPAVDIVVDLAGSHDGRVPVEVTAFGGRPTHFAIQAAISDGYEFHDVRLADGTSLAESSGRYRLPVVEGAVIVVRYEAEPGGRGRHGAQGVVAEDHALFDGRLFLLPEGALPLGAARIRFVTPEGWTVASPFRAQGEWYYVDVFEPELTATTLGSSCIGVGLFEHETREVGEMEVRVATHSTLDESHKARLADGTLRMLEYYHDTLGFDLRAPYSVVWVPAEGLQRVFGGSFSNGTCFEHPTDRLRNWELLGHRVAHAVNHYRPAGMEVTPAEDDWFTEGWASYMEATSTAGAGIAADESRWNRLYSSYGSIRERSPDRDLALADEKNASDRSREFLHYVKGPLVVKMLERLMLSRTGKGLEPFMAAMWSEYGWFRKPFPLRRELEDYSGVSFADFWTVMVERRGRVVPVWDGYVTPAMLVAAERPPAARVGADPLSGDYLYHLAWSGDFRSFAEIEAFLVGEHDRRRELERLGVQLYPRELHELLSALPPEDRYAVARLEAAYPLEKTPGGAKLVAETEQRDGRIFAELLAAEKQLERAAGEGGLIGFAVRAEQAPGLRRGPARLGIRDGMPLAVGVRGSAESFPAEIAVVVDGSVATRKAIEISSSAQTWSTIGPDDRPDGERAIVVRVDVAGRPVIARALWQRPGTAALAETPAPGR